MAGTRRLRFFAVALLAAAQLGSAGARMTPRGGSEHMHAMGQHAIGETAIAPAPPEMPCCPDCAGSIPCPASSGHVCASHLGCAPTPAIPFRGAARNPTSTVVTPAHGIAWAPSTSTFPPDPPPPRA